MSEHKFSSTGLTEESLRFFMPAKYKDLPIHIFDTLTSTNTHAKELASEGALHGTVILAHQQTDGKGRLGRSFFSPREGLYFTVIIKPAFDVNRSTLMTSAAAVAVAESVEEVCGKAAGIKWVNDVYVEGKKICGILTEGITAHETGQLESLVTGIGINTTLEGFPPGLREVAGALEGNYSKAALTASVITRLLDFAEALARQDAMPDFIQAYRDKSLVIDKTVTVYKGIYRKDPSKELGGRPARVLDIDENGGLYVIYTDGTRETLTSGEISIRL